MGSSPKDREVEAYLNGLAKRLPPAAGRLLTSMRKPRARWVRRGAAVPLIAGGLLGFLPVLGFWMLGLGILLLLRDVPVLERSSVRLMMRIERWWRERAGRRRPPPTLS